ncbi:MAG: lysoplasmalogenase [Saprospiraceae bacterium]|nr:lysoplasmalogenase [Saprospiraceae bacterium]
MDILLKYRSFTIWYILIIIANLIFLSWLTDYKMVSKPLIMASLIGFYIGAARQQSPVFILALIFAMLGDIFLMFKSEAFFLLGLGCFLIMQILYTITFLKDKSPAVRQNIYKALPVFIISVMVIVSLWDGLHDMQLPVTIYTAAISSMVVSALIRKNVSWYLPVVVGVVLFMMSDAAIAFSKFGFPFPCAEYFIILTYMIAQFLIVRGVVERDEKEI